MGAALKYILLLVFGAAFFFFLRVGVGLTHAEFIAMLFGAMLAATVGWALGSLTGYYLSRDSDVDQPGFQLATWVNFLAWIVPIVGTSVAYMTLKFSKRSDAYRLRYLLLAWFGYLCAVVNAGWGAVSAERAKERTPIFEQPGWVATNTVHSTERCQYAAIERWPQEDFKHYCH